MNKKKGYQWVVPHQESCQKVSYKTLENEHFHNITRKHKIRLLTRYVDDILVIYDSITLTAEKTLETLMIQEKSILSHCEIARNETVDLLAKKEMPTLMINDIVGQPRTFISVCDKDSINGKMHCSLPSHNILIEQQQHTPVRQRDMTIQLHISVVGLSRHPILYALWCFRNHRLY